MRRAKAAEGEAPCSEGMVAAAAVAVLAKGMAVAKVGGPAKARS